MQNNAPQLISGGLAIIIIIAMVILGRRSRRLKKKLAYPKGQRVRLLALEFLEPPLEIALIGFLIWEELTTDVTHVAVAVIAILPGILLGRYRANQSFVAALPEHKAVVVTHTKGEVFGILVIVIFKVLEGNAESTSITFPYWLTLVLTAGLVIILADSTTRVLTLYKKYREPTPEQSFNS